MKRSLKELIKRYVVLVLGLWFAALGVAITKRGELGISPISSIPNVLSYRFPIFSIGTWLFLWNCLLIAAQAVILKKDFKLIELLQLPISLLFGQFADIGTAIAAHIPVIGYPVRLMLAVIGTVVLGFGVSLSVNADVVMNSGEAIVHAISRKMGKHFGDVKVWMDVSCVLGSVVLSLILFRFRVIGTREGTVIAALLTGRVVKFFSKRIKAPLERLFSSDL